MKTYFLKLPLCRPQRSLCLQGGFRVSYNFPSLAVFFLPIRQARGGRGDFLKYVFSIMDPLVIGHDSLNYHQRKIMRRFKMKKQSLIGAVSLIIGLSLMLWLPCAGVAQTKLIIHSARADFVGGYLFIYGENFDTGDLKVSLGRFALSVSKQFRRYNTVRIAPGHH